MTKAYISGPMTGLPEFNYPLFNRVAAILRNSGYEVVNPAELTRGLHHSWVTYMRNDIKALCDCDYIVVLPGWEASRGASLEVFIATQLGMKVVPYDEAVSNP